MRPVPVTRGSGRATIGDIVRASNTHPSLSRLIHNKSSRRPRAAIVVALGGTAAGYMAFSRTVTLSVDGQETKVRTFGDNVGDVLASKGIKPDLARLGRPVGRHARQ